MLEKLSFLHAITIFVLVGCLLAMNWDSISVGNVVKYPAMFVTNPFLEGKHASNDEELVILMYVTPASSAAHGTPQTFSPSAMTINE